MHKAVVTVSLLAVLGVWYSASAAPIGTDLQATSPQSLVARTVPVAVDSLVRRALTKRSPGGSKESFSKGKGDGDDDEEEDDKEDSGDESEEEGVKPRKKKGKSSSSEDEVSEENLSEGGKRVDDSDEKDESSNDSAGEGKSGRTTHHNFSGENNACGGSYEDDDMVVALPTDDIGDMCDKTITATRGSKSVEVKVVDECATCDSGDLDLSPAAFEALGADLSKGEMFDVSWQGGSSK
ncbi:hypothetical protein H4R35_003227 [Dimargaris xerosporica]|nr:hypothetical protein H4R35_003227 [Dimargaris xerosporica]